MKISPQWLRDFVDLQVEPLRLAEDLTLAGIAVESIAGEGIKDAIFEMEITTNRPDAMNHYGVAREASAIYGVELKRLVPKLPSPGEMSDFLIVIEDDEVGKVLRQVRCLER